VVVTGVGPIGHVTAGGGMMMVFDGNVGLLHVTVSNAHGTSAMVARRT
jgi:hypothetical protein